MTFSVVWAAASLELKKNSWKLLRAMRATASRDEGEGGDVHGHEDGRDGVVDADGLHAAGDAGREDLERGGGDAGVEGTGAGGVHIAEHDAGGDDGDDADEGLEHHGTIAHGKHVSLVGDLLGRGAGGDEAVEAGEGAAGDGDEHQGEEVLAVGSELCQGGAACDHGGGHGCLALDGEREDAEHGADDHGDHHDGGEVVTRLLEGLDGHGARKDEVDHHDGDPAVDIEVEGELHADGEHDDDGRDGDGELLPALEVEALAQPAEGDGDEGEQDGDGAGAAGGVGLGEIDGAGGGGGELEGACDHGGERRDHDGAEQPAEQQEQAAARLADVLLDELAQRLAVVLDGGVQRAEVMHGAEEDATDEDPQQNRQPAEHHRDDGAGDGARTADRAELVCERGEARCGREVPAVLHAAGGRNGLWIDAPALGQPSAVDDVAADERHGRNQYYQHSVHVKLPPRFKQKSGATWWFELPPISWTQEMGGSSLCLMTCA